MTSRLLLKAKFALGKWPGAARRVLRQRRPLPLGDVHRRLELTLVAIYGQHIRIAQPIEKRTSWARRLTHRFTAAAREERSSGIDGSAIRLPLELSSADGHELALGRYRLLALEQAERLVRGTATMAPTDALERDLFLLHEGAAIDAALGQSNPGMIDVLTAERAAALARRPRLGSMGHVERRVEALLRQSLAGEMPANAASPNESLGWARVTAASLREQNHPYRGVPAVPFWGSISRADPGTDAIPDQREQMPVEAQVAQVGNSGARKTGTTGSQGDESDSYLRDGNGEQKQSDSPESEAAAAGVGPVPRKGDDGDLPAGIAYPEWSADENRYLRDAVTVRPNSPSETDSAWATDVLRSHAALVRTIQHQFEKLRALPSRLNRQRNGDELDVAACVKAMVDRRTGNSPDDRLYVDSRPARRGVAIALLVDVSGSTATPIGESRTIIDVEKIAVLLAGEAFDALGDLYTILTFAGATANDVRLTTLKDFKERNGDRVRRRISAISPAGYTRLGAAVRHATALLARQTAGHRLLLILSDGRPNDVDSYMGTYGVEDSRRAILEARASGVYSHCITIDREGADYLPRIFGQAGHTILRQPAQLPLALLGVVRQLLRSA